jgi:hypothetical protein
MVKSTYLTKRLITHNHVILPRSGLYTLILIFPDATSQQILGSEPVVWELNNTGNSLRQPIIIIIIIIIINPRLVSRRGGRLVASV